MDGNVRAGVVRIPRVTFEEARAQFPVLERLAYLQAGSVGPLARGTIEAMQAEEERGLQEGRGSRARFDAPPRRCARSCGPSVAALVGVGAGARRADRVDDRRLQHRARGPRSRAPATRSSRRPTSTSASSGRSTRPGARSSSPIPNPSGSSPRSRRGRGSSRSRTSSGRRAQCFPCTSCGRRPACRSSWTERSRSARCRSTRPGSTSTRSPGRSGCAGPRGPARSSSPTRTRCASAARATSRSTATSRTGRSSRSRGSALRPEPHAGALTRAGLRAAIGRSRRGRTSARPAMAETLPRRGWPRRAATSSCPRSARRSSRGASPRRSRRIVAATRGGGRHRARPARARARPRVRRLVDERGRPRAARRRAVGSSDVLRPRLRAADPADLGRRGVARRPRARGRGRQPLRRLRRDTGRAGARRRRDPARRPRPVPLLRGARAALRGARLRRRSRSTTSDALRGRRSATTTSSTCRTSSRRRRRASRRTSPPASRTSAQPGCERDLHGRLLLRRPELVARRGVRARPRGRDRLLRASRRGPRRHAGADCSARPS